MRVPWTARRSKQSILKEINPQYSLEELMLKLKLQYFGHLMQRADSFEKTLILGLPQSSVGEKFICNEEDLGLIPGFGRPTGEGIGYPLQNWASLMAQLVRNLPAMWETWV